MKGQKEHVKPEGLFKSPAFSQVVTTRGNGRTIYVGGQNAVNQHHEVIGQGDLARQTEQVMRNLQVALAACGAGFSHLVKVGIYLVQGQDARQGFAASQQFLGDLPDQPIVTVLFVAALGHPDYLVEMDAVAFVPED